MSQELMDVQDFEYGENSKHVSKSHNAYIDVDANESWLASNLHRLMIFISVVWFAIVLIYITQFFGWDNLLLMMPNEFGGFLAGVTLPLVVIWVAIAYIDRGTSFNKEAKFLRAYMNQLVYPEEGGAKTAKAMADAIRSQTVELQEVTKIATQQTEVIKNELSARVEDFGRLVAILDNYSGQSMRELLETVETITKSFEYVTDRATQSTDTFKESIADFSTLGSNLQRDLNSMMSVIIPKMQVLEDSSIRLDKLVTDNENRMDRANEVLLDYSSKTGTNMEYVTELLNTQINKINDVASKVVDEFGNMGKSLDDELAKVDGVLKNQSKYVLEHVDLLDKKSDLFAKKMSEHGDLVNIEVEKILARTGGIEESISMQVRDLDRVAKDVENSMREVEDSINGQIVRLDDTSKQAVSSIDSVVSKLEDEISSVENLTTQSIDKLQTLTSDVENKKDALQFVSTNIVEKLQSLGAELDAKTVAIRSQSEDSVSKFEMVGEAMHKNADALTEVTSVIVSQSKIGESSLAQQQRHLADSISKLEATKGELKRQIDEISHSAQLVNEEAEVSLTKIKKQLENVVDYSTDMNNKSKQLLEDLQGHAVGFDETAGRALSKAEKVGEIISTQNKNLETVSENVSSRVNEIGNVLSKHAKMVDDATVVSTQTYKDILSSFESQSVLLNSVAENTVSYVSDVVQALDEKAEAINLLFKHQENEFKDVFDRISDNTSTVGGSLKQQLSQVEQSADRIFSRMALLEEDVNKRSDTILTSSNRTIDKLIEVDGQIGDKNKSIDTFVQDATSKLSGLAEDFQSNINAFSNIIKETKDESNAATNGLLGNFNKVKEVNNSLVQETKNVSSLIDNNIKGIDLAMAKVKSQYDSIKNSFEQQKESLTDIVNVVATQSRLGEASLSQQYKMLSDISTDVAKKINSVNDKFKNSADSVSEITGKLAYEVDVLGEKLLKAGDDIALTSKASIKDVEQVTLALGNCSEDLANAATNSTNQVGKVMGEYEGYISRFNSVTSEASSSVVEMSGLITLQSDKMIKISEDTKELVESFNVVLNDTSAQLANRANFAHDKVKGLGDNFKNLSLQLEEAAKLSAQHMENSGDKLRSSINEIAANAERVSSEIRTSGDDFAKQSEMLDNLTGHTVQKVREAMNYITQTANEFSEKANEAVQNSASFNASFSQQVDILNETSKKAAEKVKELKKGYDNAQLDSFFKSAASIVEQLEVIGVDINRVYDPESEEELWKKYYNGDSAAFVRHLSKSITKKQIINIRSLFENNTKFRSFVTRYLSEFEAVLEKAKSNEKSSLLLSVLSGSDIGKVYYILAKALDKID